MKSSKLKIALVFFIVLIVALTAAIVYYNKPHVDVKNSDAAFVLTAENLISEYQSNEVRTTAKYSERVIQVEGKVFEISTLKGNSIITLKDETLESSIICHMLPEENKKALQILKGQNISIKGISTGYLMDVIMVRCTLVE